jgi:hypothetical protein
MSRVIPQQVVTLLREIIARYNQNSAAFGQAGADYLAPALRGPPGSLEDFAGMLDGMDRAEEVLFQDGRTLEVTIMHALGPLPKGYSLDLQFGHAAIVRLHDDAGVTYNWFPDVPGNLTLEWSETVRRFLIFGKKTVLRSEIVPVSAVLQSGQ